MLALKEKRLSLRSLHTNAFHVLHARKQAPANGRSGSGSGAGTPKTHGHPWSGPGQRDRSEIRPRSASAEGDYIQYQYQFLRLKVEKVEKGENLWCQTAGKSETCTQLHITLAMHTSETPGLS